MLRNERTLLIGINTTGNLGDNKLISEKQGDWWSYWEISKIYAALLWFIILISSATASSHKLVVSGSYFSCIFWKANALNACEGQNKLKYTLPLFVEMFLASKFNYLKIEWSKNTEKNMIISYKNYYIDIIRQCRYMWAPFFLYSLSL